MGMVGLVGFDFVACASGLVACCLGRIAGLIVWVLFGWFGTGFRFVGLLSSFVCAGVWVWCWWLF